MALPRLCVSLYIYPFSSLVGYHRCEVRRSTVRKRTLNPVFDESFIFKVSFSIKQTDLGNVVRPCSLQLGSLQELSDCLVRVAIWHQQLLGEDTFLGEVHLSVGALSTSRFHEAWYTLSSHWEMEQEVATPPLGSLRLQVSYHEDLIHPMSVYEPLKQMLLDGLLEEASSPSVLAVTYTPSLMGSDFLL